MADYQSMSKAELIALVEELEAAVAVLRGGQEQEELLQFPWVGNLGRWEFDVVNNRVRFNRAKVEVLGFQSDEVPKTVPYQFFTERVHPDDYDTMMDSMRRHLQGQEPAYEVSYRIRAEDGTWKWFYDRGVASKRSADGRPELISGIVFDITEQKAIENRLVEQNRRLHEMATVDSLTGIWNRKTTLEALEGAIDQARHEGTPLSIMMLDLDHFKAINDEHGHVVGDAVLKEAAALISQNIREQDLAGRYGGEEFLVILPNTSAKAAAVAAERIRCSIAAASFAERFFDGNGLALTISAGVSSCSALSTVEWVAAADQQLYLAKSRGRNQVVVQEDCR